MFTWFQVRGFLIDLGNRLRDGVEWWYKQPGKIMLYPIKNYSKLKHSNICVLSQQAPCNSSTHWPTQSSCCTDFLHRSGSQRRPEVSRMVKNRGLSILGFEKTSRGDWLPNLLGCHINHPLSLLLRFLKDAYLKFIASASTRVATKQVSTRSVFFNSPEEGWRCPPSSDLVPGSTGKWELPFLTLMDAYVVSPSWCCSSNTFPKLVLPSKSWLKHLKGRELQLQNSLPNTANRCALPVTWSYLLKKRQNKANFQRSITTFKTIHFS